MLRLIILSSLSLTYRATLLCLIVLVGSLKALKKSTPYAAQVAVEAASKDAKENGIQTISIHVSGAGSQREAALRALFGQNFVVTQVVDVSALPHNGVKPPKKRRV
jgi:small subunit ribosomal protein S11